MIGDLARHEVEVFLDDLALAVEGLDDLADVIAVGIMRARRLLDEHELLQRVLDVEPEIVLPHLTVATDDLLETIVAFLCEHDRRIGPDDADYMARLFLSVVTASGGWDLSSRAEVDELVASQFMSTRPQPPMEVL